MGVDAEMVVRWDQELTDAELLRLSYETVAAFGTKKLWVRRDGEYGAPRHALSRGTDYELVPDPGAFKTLLTVHLWTRYYGSGYERGDLPFILSLTRWFRTRLDGCTIYYGGDSGEALLELTSPEGEGELWQHFVDNQHFPYTKGWDRTSDDAIPTPRCDFCDEPTLRYGWGNGGLFGAFNCPGCGWTQKTQDGGKTWTALVCTSGTSTRLPFPQHPGCAICHQPVPDWPAGWLRTEDGRDYCPEHKGELRWR